MEKHLELISAFCKKHGLWAALCIYYIWQNNVNYEKLNQRTSALESYMRTKYELTINKNTEVLTRFIEKINKEK